MNGAPPQIPDPASQYKGKRVLITGGFGFIGSSQAIRLVNAGAQVTVIDSFVSGCGANPFNLAPVKADIRFITLDIGRSQRFAEELRGSHVIFNLAGEISHSRSMAEPVRDLHLNTVSQLQFLLACRAFCPRARIVYAGTRQVYGIPEYLPVNEEHVIQPVDFNGIHKYAAAQYHVLLSRRGDLDCIVLAWATYTGRAWPFIYPSRAFWAYMSGVL